MNALATTVQFKSPLNLPSLQELASACAGFDSTAHTWAGDAHNAAAESARSAAQAIRRTCPHFGADDVPYFEHLAQRHSLLRDTHYILARIS